MAPVYATRVLLSLLVVAVAFPPAAGAQNATRRPVLSPEAFLLLDPEGRTVHAKNAEAERPPPAS
jgi:hypothetical protein